MTDQVIWWSDQVENLSVGRTYDFSRAFTEQFDVLLHDSFLPCLSNTFTTSENSQYVHGTNNVKNCYLVFNAAQCENCEYSESIYDSQNTYDSYFVRDCELCYDSIGIIRCRGCISLEESEDCSDVDFSYYMK